MSLKHRGRHIRKYWTAAGIAVAGILLGAGIYTGISLLPKDEQAAENETIGDAPAEVCRIHIQLISGPDKEQLEFDGKYNYKTHVPQAEYTVFSSYAIKNESGKKRHYRWQCLVYKGSADTNYDGWRVRETSAEIYTP